MTKRILVPLDIEPEEPPAWAWAVDLARRHGAAVTGLAFIDRVRVDLAARGAMVESMDRAAEVRERLTEEAGSAARALGTRFALRMQAAGVPCAIGRGEGDPVERIVEEQRAHDVVLFGREQHFYYPEPDVETPALERIVKTGLGVALVAGADARPVRRALLAYDGSLPAARTIQRFAQLRPFGTEPALDLLHVIEKGDEEAAEASRRLLDDMRAYLQAHGFADVSAVQAASSDHGAQIREEAQTRGAELIVMGAHAVSAVRRAVFGSTTHDLLTESAMPLFVGA